MNNDNVHFIVQALVSANETTTLGRLHTVLEMWPFAQIQV